MNSPGSNTVDKMAMYKCKIYGFQSFVRKLFLTLFIINMELDIFDFNLFMCVFNVNC